MTDIKQSASWQFEYGSIVAQSNQLIDQVLADPARRDEIIQSVAERTADGGSLYRQEVIRAGQQRDAKVELERQSALTGHLKLLSDLLDAGPGVTVDQFRSQILNTQTWLRALLRDEGGSA